MQPTDYEVKLINNSSISGSTKLFRFDPNIRNAVSRQQALQPIQICSENNSPLQHSIKDIKKRNQQPYLMKLSIQHGQEKNMPKFRNYTQLLTQLQKPLQQKQVTTSIQYSQEQKIKSKVPNQINQSNITGNSNNKSRVASKYKYSAVNDRKEKQRHLGKHKYFNQLAQLEYEDKMIELHTKFTKVSKAAISMKMKARNQVAEFEEEEQQDQFIELMEFKYGPDREENHRKRGIYYERDEIRDYVFCKNCDTIHNDHPEVHTTICQRNPIQNDLELSLQKIRTCLSRLQSRQAQELQLLLGQYSNCVENANYQGMNRVSRVLMTLKFQCKDEVIVQNILEKVKRVVARNDLYQN